MVHQDPASEGTLEELRRVVEALPRMPRNIVDDTRHEKVLSYVSAFIAQEDPALYHTMLVDWGILDIFEVLFVVASDISLPVSIVFVEPSVANRENVRGSIGVSRKGSGLSRQLCCAAVIRPFAQARHCH